MDGRALDGRHAEPASADPQSPLMKSAMAEETCLQYIQELRKL